MRVAWMQVCLLLICSSTSAISLGLQEEPILLLGQVHTNCQRDKCPKALLEVHVRCESWQMSSIRTRVSKEGHFNVLLPTGLKVCFVQLLREDQAACEIVEVNLAAPATWVDLRICWSPHQAHKQVQESLGASDPVMMFLLILLFSILTSAIIAAQPGPSGLKSEVLCSVDHHGYIMWQSQSSIHSNSMETRFAAIDCSEYLGVICYGKRAVYIPKH